MRAAEKAECHSKHACHTYMNGTAALLSLISARTSAFMPKLVEKTMLHLHMVHILRTKSYIQILHFLFIWDLFGNQLKVLLVGLGLGERRQGKPPMRFKLKW